MKRYMCLLCGYIYDEEKGAPDEGIAPGTKWEDVPPNWRCPDCNWPTDYRARILLANPPMCAGNCGNNLASKKLTTKKKTVQIR